VPFAVWLLIGLPAGALMQRYPLRATQMTVDIIRAVAIASIPGAYAPGLLSVAQLVVVALSSASPTWCSPSATLSSCTGSFPSRS
jgi:hypothetical protein